MYTSAKDDMQIYKLIFISDGTDSLKSTIFAIVTTVLFAGKK